MATNIPPKQANHLKCPTCLANMPEPKAFSCFHLFCQKCIDDMKLMDGQSAPTIKCPICEKPTLRDGIHPMDSIQELMEVMRAPKQTGHVHCDKCKNETQAVSRCLDCKENFCTPCHDNHNSFTFLKHHKWEKLSEVTKVIIDKHVYCQQPEHSGELVKLVCKDCNLLICMLCGVTEHKTHEAETITKAIATALESNKEHQSIIADLIEENEKALEETTIKAEERKKQYEDMEKEVENKCEEIISKAREDCKKVKKQIQEMRNKEFRKVERFRKQTEATIQSQQNMKILAEAACSNARGTSLLQFLEAGIGESIESTSKEAAKGTYQFGGCPVLRTHTTPEENLIGVVAKEKHVSDYIDRSLTDLSTMTPTSAKEIKSIYSCPKLLKKENELWFLKNESNTIDVHALDGTKLRSVQYKQVKEIRSASIFSNKLVIATGNGMFIADFEGNVEYKAGDWDLCDVSIMDETYFLLDNGQSKVHILQLDNNLKNHTILKQFVIRNYGKGQYNTIQVTWNHIFIASRGANAVFQYDHEGALQTTHKICSTPICEQLSSPKLCGVDVNGSLLIARNNSGDHNIVILTTDGQWQSFSIPRIANPNSVVVYDDTLWVYGWNKNICIQYSFI